MARKTLNQISQERGYKSVREMVTREIEKAGSVMGAATNIGVRPFTVQNFLSRNSLKVIKSLNVSIVEVA